MSKPKIPEDHPIREIWEINKKQHDINWVIKQALDGDVDYTKELWGIITLKAENERPLPPEIMEYLRLIACGSGTRPGILSGAKPDEAMGYAKNGKGRPVLTGKQKIDRASLGYKVALLLDESGKLEHAAAVVAESEGVSVPAAKKAYQGYMNLNK